MAFKVNTRVSLKKNFSQRGIIEFVHPGEGGYMYYDVIFDNGAIETLNEYDLILEVINSSPWKLLTNGNFEDHTKFKIVSTISKIKNSSSNTISTLKASRTLFKPYQFLPLVKFLRSPIKRLLIADEVGLGKTIEAGHIILELLARNEVNNILVVCNKSLQEKWKMELSEKFNIRLKVVDKTKAFIEEIKEDVESNSRSVSGIITYAKCRNKDLLEIIETNNYKFDVVICDEAHSLRNSNTQTHKALQKICDLSIAAILLTATPIMIDIDNLRNILKILDLDTFETKDIFNNAINQNKPFIRALADLNKKTPLQKIKENLQNNKISQSYTADDEIFFKNELLVNDFFEEDELYGRLLERFDQASYDDTSSIVHIQNDLVNLNSLSHILTRTKKKDVIKVGVRRHVISIPISLSPEERVKYDEILEDYNYDNHLTLINRKRQMESCIPAFINTREDLEQGTFTLEYEDSKFNHLGRILAEVGSEKVIVFSYWKKTLEYLKTRLRNLNIRCEIIHGDIKDRYSCINKFKDNQEVQILLSSEVGSEGLDLQFCHILINYDLPWNPMKVEQRIGRIDRIGQQSAVINIYNLYIQGSIEEKILNRLYSRIKVFEESLGALEEILGEEENKFKKIEEQMHRLYLTKLSEAEEEELIQNTVKVIENEKSHLQTVKSELEETFTNDLYFQNEIDKILHNNRYLTAKDLSMLINFFFKKEMSSVQLNKDINNENILYIKSPLNKLDVLFEFLDGFITNKAQSELFKEYKKFKRHIKSNQIPITFNQEFAFENKSIEFISSYHPLILAICWYFEKLGYDKNQVHKLNVPSSIFEGTKLDGLYLLGLVQFIIHKNDGLKVSSHSRVHSVTLDLNGDTLVLLNDQESELLFSRAQIYGEIYRCEGFVGEFDEDTISIMRRGLSAQIMTRQKNIQKEEEIKFQSSLKRRLNQQIDFYSKRLDRRKKQQLQGSQIKAIVERDIEVYQDKIKRIEAQKLKAEVGIKNELISLNLIHVY